jgi:hypothetical protein
LHTALFFAAEQLYFMERLAKGRLYREIYSLLFEITDYNISAAYDFPEDRFKRGRRVDHR